MLSPELSFMFIPVPVLWIEEIQAQLSQWPHGHVVLKWPGLGLEGLVLLHHTGLPLHARQVP